MSSRKPLAAIAAIVLSLVMCFSLVACGTEPAESSKAPDTTQAAPETTKAAPETTKATESEAPTEPVPAKEYPSVGEPDPAEADDSLKNNSQTFLLQESTFDGVFNPFFYSSAYDGDVCGFVNVGLLTVDATGAVVAGNQYDTVAQSYEIYYTDDLNNFTKKDTFEEGNYVVYEMVLKHGAKFSDGTDITAEDVLFNYYVLLDPAYVGSSTLYTLPILGLTAYRTQIADESVIETLNAKIKALFNAKRDAYEANDQFTEDEFNAFRANLDEKGKAFVEEIIAYVNKGYASDAYVQGYFNPDLTYADVAANENLKNAFGASMWGFGDFNDDGVFVGAGTKTEYGTVDTIEFTAEDYWQEVQAAYTDGEGVCDYYDLSSTESAGSDLTGSIEAEYMAAASEIGSVKNIAGLIAGTTEIDGLEYETVKVVLTEQNPKAILSLGVTVTPKAYYTAGYEYKADAVVNAGVPLGINDTSFIDHLQSLNAAPAGAGVYKFVKFEDGNVTFVRNDYHYTMGDETVTNAKIKNVVMIAVESGKEYEALKAGDVDYANPSADSKVVSEIATIDNLTSILVDNLGYGYICINPQAATNNDFAYNNVHARIALNAALKISEISEYYPNGLADVIYRSQSQVSWAYPEGTEAIYPFDETMKTTIEELKLAGYTFDEASGKFTDVPEIDFYIPSAADDHPAGGVFLATQELLAKIGVTANIKVDSNLIANIKKAPVPVYALAWQSSQDPDMYQVYHYQSAAESVISNGIAWLYQNGGNDDLGTIDVTKLDGSTVTMNQKDALAYLAELIEEGTKYMSVEERKPIYEKALEVLAQLAIEIPTYQRKNMFAYNNGVLDGTTMSEVVTPYWGPLAEIWKLSFAE